MCWKVQWVDTELYLFILSHHVFSEIQKLLYNKIVKNQMCKVHGFALRRSANDPAFYKNCKLGGGVKTNGHYKPLYFMPWLFNYWNSWVLFRWQHQHLELSACFYSVLDEFIVVNSPSFVIFKDTVLGNMYEITPTGWYQTRDTALFDCQIQNIKLLIVYSTFILQHAFLGQNIYY